MGYWLRSASAMAGDLVSIGLCWRVRVKPLGDYPVFVQLRNTRGQIMVGHIGRPA